MSSRSGYVGERGRGGPHLICCGVPSGETQEPAVPRIHLDRTNPRNPDVSWEIPFIMAETALLRADTLADVLPAYRNTPVESLLRFHNMREQLPPTYERPQLLIGMCMDHRKDLTIPNEFAYVLRSAGANLRDSEFEISYAVAVGGVSTIALLGHTDCGMVDVSKKRPAFIAGLVRAGWQRDAAAAHFDDFAHRYEIGDAVTFTVGEALRLRQRFPALLIAPLLYAVEDDSLLQIVV
jgi:carbonic anhydrase